MKSPVPVVLEGEFVRLEPAEARHAASLALTTDAETFRYFPTGPATLDEAGLARYIADHVAAGVLPFAVIDRATGRVVGHSTYMDIRTAHRGLEIGCTWYAADARGTRVNPEAKRLLLEHAFEELGAARVQLKCDARNEASQRAITKLGAQREGVLRKHYAMGDGFLRDTVMFSIIADEWPAVKAELLRRLR